MSNDVRSFTLRLDSESYDMLDKLSKLCRVSKQQYIVSFIRSEYDKLQGNPELMNLLDQLSNLTDQINKFSGSKF